MEDAFECYVKYSFPIGNVEFIFRNSGIIKETVIYIQHQINKGEYKITIEKMVLPNHKTAKQILEFMSEKKNTLDLRDFIFLNC